MKGKHSNPKKKTRSVNEAAAGAAPKKNKSAGRAPLIGAIAGGVVAAVLVLMCGFTYLYPSIFPGVSAGSIPVSGMSRSEAADAIERDSPALYEGAEVSVTIYEKDYTIPVSSVLDGVDAAKSAENAYAVGRTGNPFYRMWQVAKSLFGAGDARLAANVDEAGLEKALTNISSQALTEPVEPTWDISANTMTIYAGKPGVRFDLEAVRKALTDKIKLMDFTPYEVDTELTDKPVIDVEKIAAEVIGEATNATVSKEDGTTIIPEKMGVQMDVAEAKKIVGDGTAESYSIPVTATVPKVTAADLKEKLFRDTLARTSTSLSEGNVARTSNVRLASSSINGTILNPGDEFSYNTIVGERTEARGYRPAGAYSGGKIIEEFGGGVCQPSSTLYMAVLRADLEVVERRNHSFTVSYTPLGEDATVDYGTIDFRFKNNTDYPVKILAEQTDGQMIMTIVGTKTSDKTIETRTEVLAVYSPQTVQKKDNSMPAGKTRTEVSGITGYLTRTYKQITENGKTTEVLANESRYDRRDEVVYVGTLQPQAPPSEPSTPATGGDVEAPPEPPSEPAPPSEPPAEPDPPPSESSGDGGTGDGEEQ